MLLSLSTIQGRRKQSADGQAQFDVNDEIGNNSRAKRVAKFKEVLTLLSSFKMGVTICSAALQGT